jgi:hypothetical protein
LVHHVFHVCIALILSTHVFLKMAMSKHHGATTIHQNRNNNHTPSVYNPLIWSYMMSLSCWRSTAGAEEVGRER